MANIPELISKMATGNGVFKGDAVFALADGSFVDKDGKEVAAASPIAASAYSNFEGFAVPSEVTAEATALSAAAASGAISTHNTDAGAHAILARKSETMRLLISRTIGAGENVSAITWTQDDAGNALALIDAEIRINVPENSIAVETKGYVFSTINGMSGASDYQSAGSVASASFMLNSFKTVFGHSICRVRKTGTKFNFWMEYQRYSSDGYSSGTNYASTNFSSSAITSIYMSMSGLTYFPTGTTIEIYGRTA